jgi:hypothetical protein
VDSSPSTVSVRENHNATLICKAEGTPQPTITWRREDNQNIILKRKKKEGKKGTRQQQQQQRLKIKYGTSFISVAHIISL